MFHKLLLHMYSYLYHINCQVVMCQIAVKKHQLFTSDITIQFAYQL